MGSHFRMDCSVGDDPSVLLSVSAVDPGSVHLGKGTGYLASVTRPNVILCVLSLMSIKQVRRRSAFHTGSAASEQVLIHSSDTNRLRTMLRIANALPSESPQYHPPTGLPSPTVVLVGTFLDGLTDGSVRAAHAVLGKLLELCELIKEEDGLSTTVHRLFTVNCLQSTCVSESPAAAVLKPGGHHNSAPLSSMWEALLCAPAVRSSGAPATVERAVTHAVRSLKRRRCEDLLIAPPHQLLQALFALGVKAPRQALARALPVLQKGGDVFVMPGGSLASAAESCGDNEDSLVLLSPPRFVALFSLLERFVGAAQGLDALPDVATASHFHSLRDEEVVLLRNGLVPMTLLASLFSSCDPRASAWAELSGFGVPCCVRLNGPEGVVLPAYLCPWLLPSERTCPEGVVTMARRLGIPCQDAAPAAHGEPHGSASALSLVFPSSLPPHFFALLTAAVGHLILGTVYTNALWLAPHPRSAASGLVRGFLSLGKHERGRDRLEVLFFFFQGDAPSAALRAALFEKDVLDSISSALSRWFPTLTASCAWEADAAHQTRKDAPPGEGPSTQCTLAQLDHFFSQTQHVYSVV